MDRILRIIGVAIVAALPLLAYRAFDRAVSAEPVDAGPGEKATADADPEPDLGDPIEGDASADWADAAGEPPRSLAFGAGKQAKEARTYRVGALTDDDRGGTPASEDRSSEYPTETELVPDASLATVDFIEPGLFASTFDAKDCSYELRRVDKWGEDHLIGQERLREGRLLVSINPVEPDTFSSVPQCRSWSPWSPLAEPLVRAGVGDYWIGDLARGTWAVPEGCLWEKVVAFRGARLADVTESNRGPDPLVVDEDTLGVRLRDCDRAFFLLEAEPPAGLGYEPGLQP